MVPGREDEIEYVGEREADHQHQHEHEFETHLDDSHSYSSSHIQRMEDSPLDHYSVHDHHLAGIASAALAYHASMGDQRLRLGLMTSEEESKCNEPS